MLRLSQYIVRIQLCRINPALNPNDANKGARTMKTIIETLACMAIFALWGVMLALGV